MTFNTYQMWYRQTITTETPLRHQRSASPLRKGTSSILLYEESVRPKKNPVFRATRPYLSEPADPRLFFNENTVVFFFSLGSL